MKKKTWINPELIVLVRSKPEEAVLIGCKHYLILTDRNGANSACFVTGCSTLCADQASS